MARPVPFTARISVFLGGTLSQLGWGFTLFGIIIVILTMDIILTPEKSSNYLWVTILIFWFFPVMGFILVANALRRGRANYQLLKEGELSQGELIEKEATNTSINDQTVYRLRFRFYVDSRQYHVDTKTHLPDTLENQAAERLLYLPSNPHVATMIDNLPGKVRVNSDGQVKGSVLRGLAVIIVPLAATLLIVSSLVSRIIN